MDDLDSVFYFYQKLIQLRKQVPVITDGDYLDLAPEDSSVFAYQRKNQNQQLICINNFYAKEAQFELDESVKLDNARYLLGNYKDIGAKPSESLITLRPYETKVILVEA